MLLFWSLDPAAVGSLLPEGRMPLLIAGRAIVALAYARSGSNPRSWLARPLGAPANQLAYRIPVAAAEPQAREADAEYETWVPHRATSSWIEAQIGRRFLRGTYRRAQFTLEEHERRLELRVVEDEREELYLRAELGGHPPGGSMFKSVREIEHLLRTTERVRPADRLAPEMDALFHAGATRPAIEPLLVHEVRAPRLQADGPLAPSARFDSAYRLMLRRSSPAQAPAPRRAKLDPFFGEAGLTAG